MATPDVQRDSIEAGGSAAESPPLANPAEESGVSDGGTTTRLPRRGFGRLDQSFYVITAVVGVGFLVVLFGAYVIPNLVAILVGTIIIVVGVIAWIFAALLMIATMLKSLFSRGGKTDSPHQPRLGRNKPPRQSNPPSKGR